jgi:signal transduction histidine kinase
MNEQTFLKLLDIGRNLIETRELEPLLDLVVMAATDLVGAERGYLVLLDEGDEMIIRAKLSCLGEEIESPETQINRTILEKVIFTGEPLVIVNAPTDEVLNAADSSAHLSARSVMCTPLISRGKILGAIYVDNRLEQGAYEAQDLKPLRYMAPQAAIAVDNAIFHQSLKTQIADQRAELERNRQEFELRYQETLDYNKDRSELLTTVSHDIRSPLSTAMGALDLLKVGTWGEVNTDQLAWIDMAIQMLSHISKLMQDFFDLSKLQMGKFLIYPERVNVEEYLQEQYRAGQTLPWNEGISFELDLAENLPEMLMDKDRIQQVIQNLLSNAVKYTQNGKVCLYARTINQDEALLIGVKDTGVGILSQDYERIFSPYEQAGDITSRKKGTGLGLAICKELVELHGGRIWVESEISLGSNFQFILPIEPQENTPE